MIVVFDLDGTLVDASKLHSKILSELIGKEVDPAEIYSSSSLKFFLMKKVPADERGSIKDMTRKHEARMLEHVNLVEPMPGVYEMLQKIKFKKAVFTSASRKLADAMLKHCYLNGYFDMIVTADDVTRSKPDSEGLFIIANALKKDKLVVVGNSERDLLAAKKFGATSILFSQSKPKALSADYVATSLKAIPALVESI